MVNPISSRLGPENGEGGIERGKLWKEAGELYGEERSHTFICIKALKGELTVFAKREGHFGPCKTLCLRMLCCERDVNPYSHNDAESFTKFSGVAHLCGSQAFLRQERSLSIDRISLLITFFANYFALPVRVCLAKADHTL